MADSKTDTLSSPEDLVNLSSFDKAVITHLYQNGKLNTNGEYLKYIEHFEKANGILVSDIMPAISKQVQRVPFPPVENSLFTFVDLFAGIGGFRLALQQLGGKCVFSSEWDKDAQLTYNHNFGEMPFGDITNPVTKSFIPKYFDVLCAGFPCQPFSKGGFRNGFEDTRGTLFFDICEILLRHKPRFVLLENVANLASHDNGNTYKVICKNLDELGYYFPDKPLILSPDSFGVPILRPRVYIPCVRKDIANGNMAIVQNFRDQIEPFFVEEVEDIDTIIDPLVSESLTPYDLKVLEMWDEFYQGIDLKVIGFPIWADYFRFEGNSDEFPKWKANFIQKNVSLYSRNKPFIDAWLKKYDNLEWCIKTHRKMEWQAGDKYKSVFECLIQFRPSGVRIKKPDKFSTLVAMNHRQIIGPIKRKITPDESKLLQSFPKAYQLVGSPNVSLKQLGNSVNVRVVKNLFSVLLKHFG